MKPSYLQGIDKNILRLLSGITSNRYSYYDSLTISDIEGGELLLKLLMESGRCFFRRFIGITIISTNGWALAGEVGMGSRSGLWASGGS
jgi:hypothetical protein